MNKKHLKWIIPVFVVILLIASFFIYTSIYYHAKEDANTYLESTTLVTVNEKSNYYEFIPALNASSTGIILYPGAKVEAKAYSELCFELAEAGFYVALVKMPLNLAFFGMNRADEVIKNNSSIDHFYLMGHSLGGAMGASYIAKNVDKFDGMIFLASYSTKDLSNTSLYTMTIYGSEDKVMNKENYTKYYNNLSKTNKEVIISGGCHAYFADYGAQKGDGTPTITLESQVHQSVLAITQFVLFHN